MADELEPVEGALRSEEAFAKPEDIGGVEERIAEGLAEKEAANPEAPAGAEDDPKKKSKATKAKKSEAKEADEGEADSFEASH